MKTYTVGSLFAGVGGICKGFKEAFTNSSTYKLLWANEIDEFACETYRTNFSHTLIQGDIRFVLNPNLINDKIEQDFKNLNNSSLSSNDKIKLKNKIELEKKQIDYYKIQHEQILKEPIDILTAGFPCQAFSLAGERKGFNDERGILFLDIIELIEKLGKKFHKPRVIFLENVKNLKSHDKGNTYKEIKQRLEKCGYTIYEQILNTMDISDLPQNRERIYIVGFLNQEDAKNFNLFNENNIKKLFIYKTDEDKKKAIRNIIDYSLTYKDAPEYYYTKEKYPHYFVTKEEFIHSDKEVRINLDEQIDEMYQFYQCRRGMYVRKNKSGVCPTLTANMGTGGHNVPLIKVNDGIRKLTPKEVFNLQGFNVDNGYTLPTSYKNRKYPISQLYKQAGNAVSIPVIKLLATEILNVLNLNK